MLLPIKSLGADAPQIIAVREGVAIAIATAAHQVETMLGEVVDVALPVAVEIATVGVEIAVGVAETVEGLRAIATSP